MEKWICKVCNYTHEGTTPPNHCPKCGASRSQFYRQGKNSWTVATIFFIIILTSIILYLLFSCTASPTVDNSAVKSLDLHQYLGKWYEVARFDHRFEQGMTNCIATYTLQDNGSIKVTNQGIKNGEWKTSTAKAKMTDQPGILRVSFFGPFYSDYRILMLAPDYTYALVGSSDANHLWILSRTPQLPQPTLEHLLHEANRRGYNTSDLIYPQLPTEQTTSYLQNSKK